VKAYSPRKVDAIAALAFALSAVVAFAQPLPVPKPAGPGGSCPHGYTSSALTERRRASRVLRFRNRPTAHVRMDRLSVRCTPQRRQGPSSHHGPNLTQETAIGDERLVPTHKRTSTIRATLGRACARSVASNPPERPPRPAAVTRLAFPPLQCSRPVRRMMCAFPCLGTGQTPLSIEGPRQPPKTRGIW
jgi:hypothetical protein